MSLDTLRLRPDWRRGHLLPGVNRGNVVHIEIALYNTTQNPPQLASGLSPKVTLTAADGTVVLNQSPMIEKAFGIYSVDYITRSSDPVGLYLAQFTGTSPVMRGFPLAVYRLLDAVVIPGLVIPETRVTPAIITVTGHIIGSALAVVPLVSTNRIWMTGFEEGAKNVGYTGVGSGSSLSALNPRAVGPGTCLLNPAGSSGLVVTNGLGNADRARLIFHWRMSNLVASGSGTTIRHLLKFYDGSAHGGLCFKLVSGVPHLAFFSTGTAETSTVDTGFTFDQNTWYRAEVTIPPNDGSAPNGAIWEHFAEDGVTPLHTIDMSGYTFGRPGQEFTFGNTASGGVTFTYDLQLDDIITGAVPSVLGPKAVYTTKVATTITKQWSNAITDVDDFPPGPTDGVTADSAGNGTYDRFALGSLVALPPTWKVRHAIVNLLSGGSVANHTKATLWDVAGDPHLGSDITNLALLDQAQFNRQLGIEWSEGIDLATLVAHHFGYTYTSASGQGRTGWVYVSYAASP